MLAHKTNNETYTPQLNQAKKILIVEDEALFARAVLKRMQKAGFECEHAETLLDGRAIAKQFEPDIVLLDMRLPDGTGLELVEYINENYSGLPVAVITAYGSAENAVSALKAGAFDYLTKPISLKQLRPLIQSALKLSTVDRLPSNNTLSLIGDSPPIQQVRKMIEKLARSQAPVM